MLSLGVILALGAAITWGLVYTIDQRILKDVAPSTILFIQAIVSVVALFIYQLFHRADWKSFTAAPKQAIGLLVLTAVLTLGANTMILVSIKHLNAATASLLEITYPLFVILFSLIMFRSHFSLMYLLGAALIMIGAGIIVAVK